MSLPELVSLPPEWKAIRLKWLLEALESGRREVSDTDDFSDGSLSIGGEHIGWKGEWQLNNPRFVSRDFYASLSTGKIKKEDILLVKDGATIGKTAIATTLPASEVAVNEHVFLLRFLKDNYPKFYFYFIQSSFAQDQIQLEVRGSAQPGLNSDFAHTVIAPKPPKSKQQSIASFLDRETARIDALIAAKERLVELLAEKRRSLITRAVTRGINAKAKMKDSGIPWLGEIPRHWETPPVYSRFNVQLGKMLDEKKIKGMHLAPYLRNVDVQWDTINTTGLPSMDFNNEDRSRYNLIPGDILICEGGEIGRSAIWKGNYSECYYQKALLRLRPTQGKDDPNFFILVMRTLVDLDVFASQASSATIQHLPAEKLQVVRYPSPPYAEQLAIVKHIKEITDRLAAISSTTDKTISLLKERRAAIITDAITGQILL